MTIKTILKYGVINTFVIVGLLGVVMLGIYTSVIKLPIVAQSHYSYVADFSNDRVLIGGSHHVFVGKVVKRMGNVILPGDNPGTQFSVEIIENIKGNLHGEVLIDQEGGYKHGILYVSGEGGDTLLPGSGYDNGAFLQPGSTYVMAVRSVGVQKNPTVGHRLGGHPNEKKLLSSNPNLSPDELRILSDKDEKVISFKAAYPNEILLDADVKHGNTLNSYQSTHSSSAL
ncbi:MAG: hypothetical protein A2494_00535 [Candidatus Lloydbacteria bacterium RIFOXYC12_FULL_46_25]|uniref:Uncharacterized protein n=1 Tax=Candidatus Lloydbacteria bacterium RIFOXYC12_FULL_46_25 TaxID=1798670 RepID=A0A1G2DS31_9BACT|nr:MAG: hypothetical protein A2494_00535 [Candidatus Lloydbacteria bacterium RIFOXYC12_FULL_46_25]